MTAGTFDKSVSTVNLTKILVQHFWDFSGHFALIRLDVLHIGNLVILICKSTRNGNPIWIFVITVSETSMFVALISGLLSQIWLLLSNQ